MADSQSELQKSNYFIAPVWQRGSVSELKRLVHLAYSIHFPFYFQDRVSLQCSTETLARKAEIRCGITSPQVEQLNEIFLKHNRCFGQMQGGQPCYFMLWIEPSSFHEKIDAVEELNKWLEGKVDERLKEWLLTPDN